VTRRNDSSSDARPPLVRRLGRSIAVLLILQLMGGMLLSPHRTFYPVYLQDLGYSALLISTLATARRVAGLLASLLGGTASDLLGRKRTLLLGQVGFLLTSVAFLVRPVGLTGALWTLGGLGLGLSTLGSQSYLIDAAPADALGLLTALYNWGYTVGGALSSPAAGFLLDRWGYGAFGLALVAFALLTFLSNLFALPPSPAALGQRPRSRTLFGYGDLVARPHVILLVLLRFLPTVYWGMALVLLPLLLGAASEKKTVIALYATLSQVCASLAQVVVGRAADRYGARWPTLITYALLTVSVAGIGLVPGNLWGLFALGTLSTAAAWSLSTLLPSWVALVTPGHERGRVLGWVHLWWNLGMVVGSLLGGVLFDRAPGLPFLISGALTGAAIAVAVTFFRVAAAQKTRASAKPGS